jgi:hypothetical protein
VKKFEEKINNEIVRTVVERQLVKKRLTVAISAIFYFFHYKGTFQ